MSRMSTFRLPDLGEGLAEAEILEWHVKPGDRVRVDQPMVSVETAKAVVEVPVPYSGTVLTLHGAVGDLVATGAPLLDFEVDSDSATVVGRMPATRDEEPAAPAPGTGRDGADGGTRGADDSRARALPAARALARELGLDLRTVGGSGATGVITLTDVLRRAGLRAPTSALLLPEGAVAEPLRGTRRAMAHSMSVSRDHVSGSTVCDDADIHSWVVSGDYMVRLVRATIAGCSAEPALNAWYDAAREARVLLPHIDLGVAVDTPTGLLVPVLRNVRDRPPEALRAALAAHKEAARRRSLAPDDLHGFTMLLSNFGTLAGRYGIPLVVPPAVAILGAGRVHTDAVVVGDAVVAHRRMPLSLSFDHRCVTGGEACRFLAAVIADLERTD